MFVLGEFLSSNSFSFVPLIAKKKPYTQAYECLLKSCFTQRHFLQFMFFIFKSCFVLVKSWHDCFFFITLNRRACTGWNLSSSALVQYFGWGACFSNLVGLTNTSKITSVVCKPYFHNQYSRTSMFDHPFKTPFFSPVKESPLVGTLVSNHDHFFNLL